MTSTAPGLRRFDGPLLTPDDPRYDAARRVWNGMVDRRPTLVARSTSTADVATAVRYAVAEGLELGVRCGGHSILGHGVPDGGMMLDLTPMGAVRVDPERRRAWVQGGAMLGALDAASLPHGLATTAGNVSHTGVGGLTLGGGMGWLARQYGLSCDNVLSFELVTADGSTVRASGSENPELYWGLRGGGGNFGVVTEFEFALHPIRTTTLTAEFSFTLDDAPSTMRSWRDLNAEAPREATFTAWVGDTETGPAVVLGFVWIGDPDEGERWAARVRGLGRPRSEQVGRPSYLDLQRRDDTVQDHAYRRYWKGHYFLELTDDVIELFLCRGTADGRGERLPAASLQAYGGAIADVAEDATAFSHRDTQFEFVTAARWTDSAEDDERIGAARRYGAGLTPYAVGQYVNTLTDDDSVGRAYSAGKLERLTALKDTYDPGNVFHLNHNIRPSTATG